ncbi:hypothetical protein P4O66_022399, partial [Electrophorus voltai]
QEEEAFTYEADKLSTATNPDVVKSMAITFILDQYSFPVVLPHSRMSTGAMTPPSTVSLSSDPRSSQTEMSYQSSPTSSSEHSLKSFREKSVLYASNLPQFLCKVDWLKPSAVQDIHWLLDHCVPQDLELAVALELLSVNYTDEKVRKLAVQRLEMISNEELLRYLLQLVQTLKVEPYHDSCLARFLIQRALRSKHVGHFFFWFLRSEVGGCPFFQQRMAVILEAYLLGCAAQKLQDILQEYSFPPDFQVPFDPRIKAGSILLFLTMCKPHATQLKECKVMASKKKPLWLEFSCMDSEAPAGPPVGIIFKHGDDLRQDMLIIQTLMVMDSIWKENSMDLNLVPYGCISTGFQIGVIEIVRDAVTIAAIQRSHAGTAGAFNNNALFDWLKGRCSIQEKLYQALEKFVSSCAGYCVATYVLGIGDRHNDNIMITNQGNLFHIDFGHILGNTKSFLGVNRERVPFVLTPDFLYVMGKVKGQTSLSFQRFKDICIQAYMSLRSQSRLLVTLFSLMLLTGIPELSTAGDMRYLRNALQQEHSQEEARQYFLQQIAMCEDKGWTVQANWWIHLVAGINLFGESAAEYFISPSSPPKTPPIWYTEMKNNMRDHVSAEAFWDALRERSAWILREMETRPSEVVPRALLGSSRLSTIGSMYDAVPKQVKAPLKVWCRCAVSSEQLSSVVLLVWGPTLLCGGAGMSGDRSPPPGWRSFSRGPSKPLRAQPASARPHSTLSYGQGRPDAFLTCMPLPSSLMD